MALNKEQVEHIANLARLKLTEEEKEKYSGQLSAILDYMEKLNAVDTVGVEETSQVTDLTNIMRSDQAEESGIADELISGAPEHDDGYLEIKKIFENR